jgi:Lon protease-like protein
VKHTATPWYTGKYDPTLIASEADPYRNVAVTYGDDAEATANAELIVRAVNSHEVLISACRLALAWFDDRHEELVDTALDGGTRDELSAALRAAVTSQSSKR